MIDEKIEQIKAILRMTGHNDDIPSSLTADLLKLTTSGDLLGLLYKLRDSIDVSIKLMEENKEKMNL